MPKINTFPLGGIHIAKEKLTALSPIMDAGVPEYVYIPIKQHIGSPAKILVNKGDKVKIGTLLADADGIISADIHSSVAGEVVAIEPTEGADGYYENMITIKTAPDEYEPDIDTRTEIIRDIPERDVIIHKILHSGIVGLGGAGFPTPIKINIPQNKKVKCLIINGIECEPYLTADERLMAEKAEEIIIGAKILNKALGIQNAIIALDQNKLEVIEIMEKISKVYVGVNVKICATKYPQGGEKQLIKAITGKEVPSGKLPMDVGCIVQNAATTFAVYEAVQKNKPLYERIITISGDECRHPANYRVRIGTPAEYLIEKSGRISPQVTQIIYGGPMMGASIVNIKAPVNKLVGGILLLSDQKAQKRPMGNCIRCGKCADSCPMGLQPYLIGKFVQNNLIEATKSCYAMDCIECGCCAYVCPSSIPLLDYCKIAKAELKRKN